MIERRRLPRLQLRCMVSLWKPSDGTFTRTLTENLTCRGFLCLSTEPYSPGDELQAILEVPASYWDGNPSGSVTLLCQVEVVRINSRQSGFACRIKDYLTVADPQW